MFDKKITDSTGFVSGWILFPVGTILLFLSPELFHSVEGAAYCAAPNPTNDPYSVPCIGSSGNDIIYGTKYGDFIDGKGGKDIIFGQEGNDLIFGGDGDDEIIGEDGADGINGQEGNDRIDGGLGSDDLQGFFGNDFITGGPGIDVLTGYDGSDKLLGGSGDDVIYGNYILSNDFEPDTINCGSGNDATYLSLATPDIQSDCEDVYDID